MYPKYYTVSVVFVFVFYHPYFLPSSTTPRLRRQPDGLKIVGTPRCQRLKKVGFSSKSSKFDFYKVGFKSVEKTKYSRQNNFSAQDFICDFFAFLLWASAILAPEKQTDGSKATSGYERPEESIEEQQPGVATVLIEEMLATEEALSVIPSSSTTTLEEVLDILREKTKATYVLAKKVDFELKKRGKEAKQELAKAKAKVKALEKKEANLAKRTGLMTLTFNFRNGSVALTVQKNATIGEIRKAFITAWNRRGSLPLHHSWRFSLTQSLFMTILASVSTPLTAWLMVPSWTSPLTMLMLLLLRRPSTMRRATTRTSLTLTMKQLMSCRSIHCFCVRGTDICRLR